jgi:hypothetical protein
MFYKDDGGTSIPELNETTCYYLIKVSSTVFKMATSYTNAVAGTAIDITGVGSTAQDWYILKTKDYGWFIDNDRKAIAYFHEPAQEHLKLFSVVFLTFYPTEDMLLLPEWKVHK